jgi:hypothetical protein
MFLQKKGRTAKINKLGSVKCKYGTVDCQEFKSIYLILECWLEPKSETENWSRIVNLLDREIKSVIKTSLNNKIFKEKFISDLDLRYSGMKLSKRSFLSLEINLFIKNQDFNFKSKEIKDSMINLSSKIVSTTLDNNKWFTIHSSKKKSILDNF